MNRLFVVVFLVACGQAPQPRVPESDQEAQPAQEVVEAPEEVVPEEETPSVELVIPPRPTRSWWESRSCSPGPVQTHVIAGGGGGFATAVGPGGGLLTWQAGRNLLLVAAVDALGNLGEDALGVTVPRMRREEGIIMQHVEGGFVLAAHARCGRRNCLVGYALHADGSPLGEQVTHNVGFARENGFAALKPWQAATDRLWLMREGGSGGRDSYLETVSLRIENGQPIFETPEHPEAAPREEGIGSTFNELVGALVDAPSSLDSLTGYQQDSQESDIVRRRYLSLGENHSRIEGLGNRVRSFLSEGGQGHLLVETDDVLEHITVSFASGREAAVVSRAPVEGDVLPTPFFERISMSVAEGRMGFNDVLDRAMGESIEVGPGVVDYMGPGLMVTHVSEGQATLTPIVCPPR